MEKYFAETVKNCLNGRKAVVWGTGPNSESLAGKAFKYCDIAFFLSKDAKNRDTFFGKPVLHPQESEINPSEHYIVVLAGDIYPEIREELLQKGFRKYTDYFDWWNFDEYEYFPYDRVMHNVFYGKYSRWFTFDIARAIYIHSIGRFCSINPNVQVHHNHQTNMITTSFSIGQIFNKAEANLYKSLSNENIDRRETREKVTIGNDVWIGANVFINASAVATIGDGAIIGAGSVVTHDVPPYAVVYGTPARIQRYRYTPEQIACLLRVKWWDWTDEQIRENAELLMHPDKFFERFM